MFQVSAPESNFRGALRVGSAFFLAQLISQVHRAWTLTTSFRANPVPGSKLAEFHMVETWSEGGFEDAKQFAEDLLSAQVKAILRRPALISKESSPLTADRARQLRMIEFPLRSVTYREAMRQTGLESGLPTTPDVAMKIAEHFGSQPLFVTHFPENLDPSFTGWRQVDKAGNYLGFVLLAPFAGNLAVGGEIETDYDALDDQIRRSTFLEELIRLGGSRDQLEPYIQSIARLATPHFSLVNGFERVTQFVLGVERIEDATLLPVRAAEVEVEEEEDA